jgi:hypothetical protein
MKGSALAKLKYLLGLVVWKSVAWSLHEESWPRRDQALAVSVLTLSCTKP